MIILVFSGTHENCSPVSKLFSVFACVAHCCYASVLNNCFPFAVVSNKAYASRQCPELIIHSQTHQSLHNIMNTSNAQFEKIVMK